MLRLTQVAVAVGKDRLDLARTLGLKLRLSSPHHLISQPQRTEELSFRIGGTDLQFLAGTTPDSVIENAVSKRGIHIHHFALGVSSEDQLYGFVSSLRGQGIPFVEQADRAIDPSRDPAIVESAEGLSAAFIHPNVSFPVEGREELDVLKVLIELNQAVDEAPPDTTFFSAVSSVQLTSPYPRAAAAFLATAFGLQFIETGEGRGEVSIDPFSRIDFLQSPDRSIAGFSLAASVPLETMVRHFSTSRYSRSDGLWGF